MNKKPAKKKKQQKNGWYFNGKKLEYLPAIPPTDYKGTQADWMIELQVRGLWDGQGWYGDVEIPVKDYEAILEKRES